MGWGGIDWAVGGVVVGGLEEDDGGGGIWGEWIVRSEEGNRSLGIRACLDLGVVLCTM